MRRQMIGLVLAGLVAASMPASAQGARLAPTWEQAVARQWRALHDKILAMANDTEMPDAKLETRPHADSRTILDELRHVTIGLEMSTAQLKGEAFPYAEREKADEAKPRTRASVVAEMEAAIAASYPVVEASAKPLLVFWLDHQGEHYGKLVSDYRMAGIVPPVSRGR